ncbi:MBL fold metallo-hydrolase [Sphingomonas sp. 1P06PA]|uniref:MBL fold metallo-hydrolase n=1 Tax=Sphingomonas sp. 1P06PA TaxID=554121 RepID=UPI0039A51363
MRLTLLGCGTSSGVPRIGNDWGDCDPADPRNRRRRASVLVRSATTTILVDTTPDMREQLLDAGIAAIDAVIWTHDHADHCHGIDDLRQLFHARGRPVQAYARAETLTSLRSRFGYAFDGHDGYPPTVTADPLPDRIMIGDIVVHAVDQPHGAITSAGLRFEHAGRAVGYSTDFNAMTVPMVKTFEALDLWVVDALRHRPHPTHPHLAATLGWIADLAPRRAVLTHMDQSMDYRSVSATLPPGVEPGYDGLEIAL